MQLAMVAAGFTPGEADRLRRSMAAWKKRGGLEHFEGKLKEGMQRHGYSAEFADALYRQILGFGEYGFPESHAASFALLVYVSSWLKCHHPAAFCAALLNSQPMGFYAPAQLTQDARRHGVEIRPPDVNASEWDCTLEGPALRLGLRMVGSASIAKTCVRWPPRARCNRSSAIGASRTGRLPARRAARPWMRRRGKVFPCCRRPAKGRRSSPTMRALASRSGAIRSRCCAAACAACGSSTRRRCASCRMAPPQRWRGSSPAGSAPIPRAAWCLSRSKTSTATSTWWCGTTWSSASAASCSARAFSACTVASSVTARLCIWSHSGSSITARCSGLSQQPRAISIKLSRE